MRTIYVNPGELLDIRVINDPDEPLNNKSFENQPRPRKTLITIKSSNHISYCDPALRIDYTTVSGKLIATR